MPVTGLLMSMEKVMVTFAPVASGPVQLSRPPEMLTVPLVALTSPRYVASSSRSVSASVIDAAG